jgi:hypothetical protein
MAVAVVAPVYRYLRGYALDPGFSTRLDTVRINEVIYRIPFETLAPGPVGEYIEIMDVDPATGTWYEPVDLRDERVASQQGLSPSEGNPQFHQQFVYAVAMKTIRHFEKALGRRIVWYPRVLAPRGARQRVKDVRWRREYIQRLRIYPHALRDANAYYDPEKAALLFGYFEASGQSQGANYPGGLIFTCLSPDIVAHETTHAILDSIHHRYMEDTNPDVAAFHEGFADIVALLQRFTFVELEALEGNRGALRSMIGSWNEKGEWVPLKPSPSDYADHTEAHDRGAVLVATIFDAFQRIYRYRTRDLIRIATGGTGVLPDGSISPDLVGRLAKEAGEIAEHLLHVCIRALDYSPPNDISFGVYLRALITADLDIAPEDENGYRVALIEAFRARGIFPRRVKTLSIESLCWNRPEITPGQQRMLTDLAEQLRPMITALVQTTDRREIYDRSQRAQAALSQLLARRQARLKPADWEAFLNQFGLTSRPVSELFGRESAKVTFLRDGVPDNTYVPSIECHTIRPAFRAGREGRQIEQVVIALTQRVTADVGDGGMARRMIFRGGCSIILNLGDLNTVEYVILKNIKSYDRFRRQAAYVNGDNADGAPTASMYADDDREWRLNFNLLHGNRP